MADSSTNQTREVRLDIFFSLLSQFIPRLHAVRFFAEMAFFRISFLYRSEFNSILAVLSDHTQECYYFAEDVANFLNCKVERFCKRLTSADILINDPFLVTRYVIQHLDLVDFLENWKSDRCLFLAHFLETGRVESDDNSIWNGSNDIRESETGITYMKWLDEFISNHALKLSNVEGKM